jgi:hypothetical protein
MLIRFLEQAFYDAVMNSAVKGGRNGIPIQLHSAQVLHFSKWGMI